VHARNLVETLEEIEKKHPNHCIIAIDASLGSEEHLGYVTLKEGSLRPGSGVQKNLSKVGDIAITGIVNVQGLLNQASLQATRLSVVMKLADCISLGLQLAGHRQLR
jgi:putative sporulation protein YyaC